MNRQLRVRTSLSLLLICLVVSGCASSTLRLAQLSAAGQDIGTQLQNAEINAHSQKLVSDENHNKVQTFFELYGKETLRLNDGIRAGSARDVKAAGEAILAGLDDLNGLTNNTQFALWISILRSTFATIVALV